MSHQPSTLNHQLMITGTTDHERTASLRAGLVALGYEGLSFAWDSGRPVCFGEPAQDWFDYNQITLTINTTPNQ